MFTVELAFHYFLAIHVHSAYIIIQSYKLLHGVKVRSQLVVSIQHASVLAELLPRQQLEYEESNAEDSFLLHLKHKPTGVGEAEFDA